MTYIYPNDRGWHIINAGIALFVLSTVAVLLRFVTRFHRRTPLGADDWTALAGYVFLIGMFAQLILWVTQGGQGYHIYVLAQTNPELITQFFKLFLVNEFTYSITSPLVKISIILFYRKIFQLKWFKRCADILIGATIAWGVATFLAAALQCRPLSTFWDPSVGGVCFDAMKYILGVQSINIILDFAILAMPIYPIWGLHRPWQDKVALLCVFLVGGFVCFASIYRIAKLLEIDAQDITYTTFEGAIWTFVEPCIGLVCGCLPVIRGLFPAYTTKRTTTNEYGYGKRSKSPMFSFGKQQSLIQSRKAMGTPNDEEYLRMPSQNEDHDYNDFPLRDNSKIRVHTVINVDHGGYRAGR